MRMVLLTVSLLLGGILQADGVWPRLSQDRTPDVVYVGTPYDVVSAMLRLARVRKEDTVCDLGCGDGRMVVLAAEKYGCRGIGYDIDPERVIAALKNVRKNRVGHLVKIVQQDLFTLDFSAANVLSLYLLPEINEKLLPKFEKLKPGSRLVFHAYGLPEMEADKEVRVISNEDNASHTLYLYTTPLKRAKN
jgi:cyclopropane fatty-acyl-phospholipid synthase-like methyltransferase